MEKYQRHSEVKSEATTHTHYSVQDIILKNDIIGI